MAEVVKFPVNHWQREVNRRGKFGVSCIVSERWLRFTETSHKLNLGSVVWLDVMTESGDGKKLCTLAVTVEDLRRVLDSIKDDGPSESPL